MGLWFWKPDEVVNPQQPLSAQLYGQGDPGEGWSQSRSATPASLADSYGGSGACSFDAPNRVDGMPDLLFGMDVQLYGSWSQVGKVTDVETDGDYTSYVVDDVLARFNKEVKVGPLAVGYTSPVQMPPVIDDPRQGDPDWETTQEPGEIFVDHRGRILQGLWASRPGGATDFYGSYNFDWGPGFSGRHATTSQYEKSPIYETISANGACYLVKFDSDTGKYITWVKVGDNSNYSNALFAYRNEEIYIFRARPNASTPLLIDVYDNSLSFVETVSITLPSWIWPTNPGLFYYAINEYNNEFMVVGDYNDEWNPEAAKYYRGLVLFRFTRGGVLLSEETWEMDAEVALSGGGVFGAISSVAYSPTIGPILVVEDKWRNIGGFQGASGNIRVYTRSKMEGSTFQYFVPGTSPRAYAGFKTAWHESLGMLVLTSNTFAGSDGIAARGYVFAILDTPTLRQAYFLYMLEAGVPLDIAIGNSSVFDEEVSYPDWEGNLLDKLVELAAVTRTQFSPGALPGTVEVGEIGGTRHEQLPQAVGGKPSLSLGTGQAVDSYTVVSQQARVVNPDSMELVYDARLEGNLIEFRPQDIIRETVSVPHSLTAVADVERGLGYGQYAVADSEGVNVTQSFEDAGGYVTVSVNPDNPRAIDIEIFGGRTKLAGTGPYSLGYGQTESNQIIPRFSILGAGIFLNPREVTIYTGADPDFSGGAIGPTFQSEFIESKDVAYDVANMVNMRYATPEFSASLSWPSGVERSEPDVGDTVPYNYGVYRVVSSTNDGFTASIGLLPATTVGDHDDVWAGETVGDHDDFWSGRLVQDVRVRPLWGNVGEPEMLQVFAKTDTDTQPYWDENPPAEGSVLKDEDAVPFYDEPAGQQGDIPLFLDVDNRPYMEDE